jgi:hypothetical protein
LLSLSHPGPKKTVLKVNSEDHETPAVFQQQQRQLKHVWAPPLNSKPTKRVHFHPDIITTAQKQEQKQKTTILNRKRRITNPMVAHNMNNNNNKRANIYVFPTSHLTTSPSSSSQAAAATDQKLLTLIAPAPLISKLNEWKMQYNILLNNSSLSGKKIGNPEDLTKGRMEAAAARMMPPPPSRPKTQVQQQQQHQQQQ